MSDKSATTSTHLVGGFFGGLSSSVTLQPLDLLKTRIQQNKNATLLTVLRQIDNPLSLWRGTLTSAMRTSTGSALYLSCLNLMRTTLAKDRGPSAASPNSSNLPQLTTYENLLAGALARGFVGYLTMPFTILKVRYESTLYNYSSIREATRDVYRSYGIKGFFRGFGPTSLRDAPYSGLYVLLYEKAKLAVPLILPRKLISHEQNGKFTSTTSATVNALSAISSASLATSITAPFDTIKTRMQLEPNRFTGFFKTFTIIVKQESTLKLFSGLSMRLTRKALSAGIAWGIYEELIKRFM